MADTRRSFITATAVAASSYSRIMGANERVSLVIIGVGGRGTSHAKSYAGLKSHCDITGICDVNQAARERVSTMLQGLGSTKPKEYADMKEVFADKSVDAVSMATPNHWHALGTIWACQAGKDVYVEKPASHNCFEADRMVDAARKYNRMVQVGTQSRSVPHIQKAAQLLKEGVIGQVYMAKGLCFKRRVSIGRKPDIETPPGIDWDKFLGPAPMRKFNELRFRYNWHWFWDTGNGDIGNQGVHQMDIALWGLGVKELPTSVSSTGGKYVYDDDQETPNTQMATFDYGGRELMFEVRGLITGGESGAGPERGVKVGNLWYGSDGYMVLDGSGFRVYKGEKGELAMQEKSSNDEDAPHMRNFLEAVKTRQRASLNAEIATSIPSAKLCHLANISYRLKRRLNVDPKAGRFVNDAEANQMLTRHYRAPYVVPAKV
ncbi:MAG: Gfo/Idh/MocA family oxidoreductase [Bryobacterales bacterium]|nr:Gfo/Idh/MocA family oxidoreductase [Bryobacterales bacterium]